MGTKKGQVRKTARRAYKGKRRGGGMVGSQILLNYLNRERIAKKISYSDYLKALKKE